MNKNRYKEEFDKVKFSDNFEERTVKLIREYAREEEDTCERSFAGGRAWGILILACVIIIMLSNLVLGAWEAWEEQHGGVSGPITAEAEEGILFGEEDRFEFNSGSSFGISAGFGFMEEEYGNQ